MPKILREFLENLSNLSRDSVWDYLYGNPDAVHEMIELVGTEDGESNFR